MRYILIVILILQCTFGFTQDSLELIILNDKVGEVVDSTEKGQYHLFPYFSSEDFKSAQLFKLKNGALELHVTMRNDSLVFRKISQDEFERMRVLTDHKKLAELSSGEYEHTNFASGGGMSRRTAGKVSHAAIITVAAFVILGPVIIFSVIRVLAKLG